MHELKIRGESQFVDPYSGLKLSLKKVRQIRQLKAIAQ